MAIVGLDSPDEAIADAVARAGADTVNPATYPVLAVATWAFSAADRTTLRLPVLPPG